MGCFAHPARMKKRTSAGRTALRRPATVPARAARAVATFDGTAQVDVQHQQAVRLGSHIILAEVYRPEMRDIDTVAVTRQPRG